MTDFNLAVGEKIWNDVTKMNGEISAVTESDITINWEDGNDIVEEVMTLDELSKATLKNYIKKASEDYGNKRSSYTHMQRAPGYTTDDRVQVMGKAKKRKEGIGKAADKLAKEDFFIGDQFELEDELFEVTNIDGDNVELRNGDDELFELSKKTLGNYITRNRSHSMDLEKDSERLKNASDQLNAARHASDFYINAKKGGNSKPQGTQDPQSRSGIMGAEDELKAHSKKVDRAKRNRERGAWRAIDRLTKEEREMNEDSMALQTVKPNSRPADDPLSIPSKLDMMKKVLTMLGNVEYNGDQVEFLNKALDYIGKEAHMIGDGSAAKNKASTANHNPSLKEDVEKLFEGQEVSDEFKTRTSNLFEAAVALRVSLQEAEIQEAYETALSEEVAELEEIMATELSTIEENVSNYMNYVTEKWLEDNQVAIESTLRNELTEEFIEGLKNLFQEHYIEIPEDRLDVLGQLEEDNKELAEAVNHLLQEKADLENIIAEATAESAFDEVTEGMKVTDVEKLKTLAEHVEFDGNIDSYKDKIKFIKESHFSKARTPKVNLNDSFITEEVQYTSPLISAAVKMLNNK